MPLKEKMAFMENFSLIMNSLLLQEIDRILAIMRKKSEQKIDLQMHILINSGRNFFSDCTLDI